MTYYPYSLRPQPYAEAGLGLAAEVAAGGMADVSGPLLVWNQSQYVNYALPKPQMVSNIYGSVTNQTSYSQGSNGRSSNSSPGGTSLSFNQLLNSLQNALQQLSAILVSYKANTSH
jgi:hypothetical protein